MRRIKAILFIMFTITALLAVIIISNCNQAKEEEPASNTPQIISYSGSDPKGDFIDVVIDKTNSTVKQINYTTGVTNGPYAYTKATGTDAMGFDIIYKATVTGGDNVAYVLFAEFPNASILYQLFDASNQTVGNPQYAIVRQQLSNTDIYDHAFNWMQFKVDVDNTNTDMNCGFAAWDNSTGLGLLYGAGYSNRSDLHGSNNGISDINTGDYVSVNGFGTDTSTISRYFYSQGISDWGHRVTLTGTPSGACILDFGISAGGGSGLALPQASSKDWSSTYNGTYFIMIYEYNDNAGILSNSIQPMKCVLSGTTTGHIKVYNPPTSTTSFTEGDLTPVADLIAANSPGGITPIKDQFYTISGLSGIASSSLKTSANECRGCFILNPTANDITMIMINPDGKFGGFTGFSNNSGNKSYRFGFCIKDPSL